MILADDKPNVFQGFVRWMYDGKLGDYAPDDVVWVPRELVDLYLFSVAKCNNKLKNTVMDALQDCLDEGGTVEITLSDIEMIFANTVSIQDAPIRKFCCALIRWFQCQPKLGQYWTEERLADFFKNCPPDVLQEYLKFLTDIWGKMENEKSSLQRNATTLFNMCYFHVHADGEECESEFGYAPTL
jgi:hypothetical protein